MHSVNGQLTLEGGKLNYQRAGAGKSMTFVHGHTLDMNMWEPQFEKFAPDYSVLRYDLRGYGQSSLPQDETEYLHRDDLRQLQIDQGIETTTLVGLSLGGQVALEYTIHNPEYVERLILIDPFLADFPFSEGWNQTLEKMIGEGIAGDVTAARQTWKNCGLFDPALKKPEAATPLLNILQHYSGWHFEHPFDFPMTSISERLGEIKIPVLILVGDKDIPDFIGISELLEEKIPNASRVVIPEAGHMASMEAPGIVNKQIVDFLDLGAKTNIEKQFA
jgi:pimeloyl-ACP methyl ester carboxylesterase